MSKKPFSDSRWRGGIEELNEMESTGYKGEPVFSEKEVNALIDVANEYRKKHGMLLYGKFKFYNEEK